MGHAKGDGRESVSLYVYTPATPMDKITVYLHSDKESMYEDATKYGLVGERAERFMYNLYEVKIDLEVDDAGDAIVTHVNGSPLVTPVDA